MSEDTGRRDGVVVSLPISVSFPADGTSGTLERLALVWDVTALKPAEKLVLLYIAADGLDDPVVACRWLNITSNRLWDLVRRLRAKGYVR